jgi:hypothetical protein
MYGKYHTFYNFVSLTTIAPTPDDKLRYKYFCHLKTAVHVDNMQEKNTAVHRATSIWATRLTQSFVLRNDAALHRVLVFVTIRAGMVICSTTRRNITKDTFANRVRMYTSHRRQYVRQISESKYRAEIQIKRTHVLPFKCHTNWIFSYS